MAKRYYAREMIARADKPWSWGWLDDDKIKEMVEVYVNASDQPTPPTVYLEVGDFQGDYAPSQELWDWYRAESAKEEEVSDYRRSRCPYVLRERRDLNWFHEGRDEV